MIIKYTAKNLFRVNYVAKNALPARPGKAQELTRLNIIPGVNFIEDDQWDDVKEHPTVAKLVDAEIIEIEKKTIDTMTEKEAIKLVGGTHDPKILNFWASKEKREKVKMAISDKIRIISEYGKNAEMKNAG